MAPNVYKLYVADSLCFIIMENAFVFFHAVTRGGNAFLCKKPFPPPKHRRLERTPKPFWLTSSSHMGKVHRASCARALNNSAADKNRP